MAVTKRKPKGVTTSKQAAPAPATKPEPRKSPYIWVTWIKGILADDDQCLYQPWFKAHFKYAREELNLDDWKQKHGEAVRARVVELKRQGWKVWVEDQNKMVVRGNHATVSGCPDIVARKPGHILIVDLKTGRQSGKDRWQVRTYLTLYPFCQPVAGGVNLYGEVKYNDDAKLVELSTDGRRRVLETIRLVGSSEEPEKTPSPSECKDCDVPDCDARDESALEGSALGAF